MLVRVHQERDTLARQVHVNGPIVDAAGHVVANDIATLAADRFAAGRGADYRISLPLAQLARGEYLSRSSPAREH